jgi:hypothetical protein
MKRSGSLFARQQFSKHIYRVMQSTVEHPLEAVISVQFMHGYERRAVCQKAEN